MSVYGSAYGGVHLSAGAVDVYEGVTPVVPDTTPEVFDVLFQLPTNRPRYVLPANRPKWILPG